MSKSSGIGIGMKELLKLTLADELKPTDATDRDGVEEINLLKQEIEELRNSLKASKAPDIDNIYKEGLNRLKAGELTGALEAFSTVLYLDPNHLKALNNTGVVYFELGLEEAAAEKFKAILIIEPDNETARDNLEDIEENFH